MRHDTPDRYQHHEAVDGHAKTYASRLVDDRSSVSLRSTTLVPSVIVGLHEIQSFRFTNDSAHVERIHAGRREGKLSRQRPARNRYTDHEIIGYRNGEGSLVCVRSLSPADTDDGELEFYLVNDAPIFAVVRRYRSRLDGDDDIVGEDRYRPDSGTIAHRRESYPAEAYALWMTTRRCSDRSQGSFMICGGRRRPIDPEHRWWNRTLR